jgi:hypothetical protein
MTRYCSTLSSSSLARNKSRKKMVKFLKFGSCRVLVGNKSPDVIIEKRHKFLLITVAGILIIGFFFVIF